jgi:hypothetical protein
MQPGWARTGGAGRATYWLGHLVLMGSGYLKQFLDAVVAVSQPLTLLAFSLQSCIALSTTARGSSTYTGAVATPVSSVV